MKSQTTKTNKFSDTQNKKKADRDYFLDLLKTIAIIFIIFGHTVGSTAQRKQLGYVFWIDQGVPIFMIISGFVFAKSYERKNVYEFTDCYRLKPIITGLLRFIIPYLIAFIAEEIIVMTTKLHAWDQDFFWQLFSGGRGPGGYYVPIMIQFVVVYPMIFFIVNKFGFKGLIGILVTDIFYEILQYSISMNANIYKYLIVRYIYLMAFGAYLNYAIQRKIKFKWIVGSISFVCGAALIACATYVNMPTFPQFAWHSTSVFGALYICPLISLMIRYIKMPKAKCFQWTGKSTFNTFLVQKILMSKIDVTTNMYVQVWLNIAAFLAIGFVFWFGEHYLTNFINNKIKNFIPKKKRNLAQEGEIK